MFRYHAGDWCFDFAEGEPLELHQNPMLEDLLIDGDGPIAQMLVAHRTRGPVLLLSMRLTRPDWPAGKPMLFVPETETLFLGVADRTFAYDLGAPRQRWMIEVDCGVWAWHRVGDVVICECELDLAAYDLRGNLLWDAWYEPPHDLRIEGEELVVSAYQLNEEKDFEGRFLARECPTESMSRKDRALEWSRRLWAAKPTSDDEGPRGPR